LGDVGGSKNAANQADSGNLLIVWNSALLNRLQRMHQKQAAAA